MAEYFSIEKKLLLHMQDIMERLKSRAPDGWNLLYENVYGQQAELLYLTGMFSGAGLLSLVSHGARKALLFIKLVGTTTGTRMVIITGGSESLMGFDFGRHKRNIEAILRDAGLD